MSDLRAFYDRKYDHLQLQGGETGQRKRKRRALRLMEKHSLLTPGKSAIEFGCGTGEMLLILREHGLEVWGVELSASAARQARDEGLEVHEFDLSSQKTPWDGKFDFCFALEVMEHVYDPWRFTFNMNYVIKVGGHALISVPNFHHWRKQLMYLWARKSPIEIENIHHIRIYDFIPPISCEGFSNGRDSECWRLPRVFLWRTTDSCLGYSVGCRFSMDSGPSSSWLHRRRGLHPSRVL